MTPKGGLNGEPQVGASDLRLELLGNSRLLTPNGARQIERRPAALLAYLALEGPTARSRLAPLLWPEVGEERARANLRQALRRLRQSLGPLIQGEEVLSLAPGLRVDAAILAGHLFSAGEGNAQPLQGELLAAHDYDDLPDLNEWLLAARESLDAARRDAAAAESAHREAKGDLVGALESARRSLALDPVSEEGHRRVMRLQYLLGDRGAALATFARLRATLEREFAALPLPETAHLASLIEAGLPFPDATSLPRPEAPFTLLRPPTLVGRLAQWQAMEHAWAEGKLILVSGEAGAGKSRLAEDFLAAKGRWLRLEGRPGDAATPYATAARNAARQLARLATLPLPVWARREAARLLPALAEGEPPEAISSDGEKLRFYDGLSEMARLACRDLAALLIDDFQNYDAASIELITYAASRSFPLGRSGGLPRQVITYRPDELSPEAERAVSELIGAGMATLVEAEPLGEDTLAELLASLHLPGVERLAAPLERFTGGNPMFALETVRHLVESGQLQRGLPARLPPPGRMREVVQRRLERLTLEVLSVARAVAVLGPDFTLERAAKVLERDPLDLMPLWEDLDRAQVLGAEGFSHDVVLQAVLDGIPAEERPGLHARAALVMEAAGCDPARTAEHWLAGGAALRAAPLLRQAAERAAATYRPREAVAFLERAAALLEAFGDRAGAFATLAGAPRLVRQYDLGAQLGELTARLLSLASDQPERALALAARADWLKRASRDAEAEAAAREAQGLAAGAGNDELAGEATLTLAYSLLGQRRHEEALALFRRAAGGPRGLAVRARLGQADVLFALDRHGEALPLTLAVARDREVHGDRPGAASALVQAALHERSLGKADAALRTLVRVDALLASADASPLTAAFRDFARGRCLLDLARYKEAFPLLEGAARAGGTRGWFRAASLAALALLDHQLGKPDSALARLAAAREENDLTAAQQCTFSAWEATILHAAGRDGAAALATAESWLEQDAAPGQLIQIDTVRSRLLPPQEASASAERALALADSLGLMGLAAGAATRAAACLLALGRRQEAARLADRAERILATHSPTNFSPAETLLAVAETRLALGDSRAGSAVLAARSWVEARSQELAPEERAAFTMNNPENRAILSLPVD